MLERLEISIVSFSQIRKNTMRLDSDYYSHENLSFQKIVSDLAGETVENIGGILDCSAFYPSITGYYSHDREMVPFLRVNEISNGLVVLTDKTVFLPQEILDKNSKTIASAYPGDLIIAKGGNTLAKVGLVTDEYPHYATCRDVIILRTDKLKNINKYFLWTFLHSKYGQTLMWRASTQTGQPHLTLSAIANLHIPKFSQNFQTRCEALYRESVSCKLKACELYTNADKSLMQETKIDMSTLPGKSISIRTFKDVTRFGRIDAEYYQPKYDDLTDKIKLIGGSTVEKVCNVYDLNYTPKKESVYKYIELSNIGHYGEINGCTIALGSELPTRARRIVHTGNIVVSSVEGSLESCALITEEYEGALCSTGFYVIDSEKINSETLLVLFKSAPIQALLKQRCTGTILTAFGRDELNLVPIPSIKEKLQDRIKKDITESFAYRRKSDYLLEIAKHAVEIAVEQGEETAIKYLEDNPQQK